MGRRGSSQNDADAVGVVKATARIWISFY